MDMEKMIRAFDMLIADSEKKGISIYENQGIAHFIIQCQEEFKMPEAYEILKAHIKDNEDIFLARLGDGEDQVFTIDTAILKLEHYLYTKCKIDDFNRIKFEQNQSLKV